LIRILTAKVVIVMQDVEVPAFMRKQQMDAIKQANRVGSARTSQKPWLLLVGFQKG